MLADQRRSVQGRGAKSSVEVDHRHNFVAAFADKIPDTDGAPKREVAPAE
jgi:hypothetical protein